MNKTTKLVTISMLCAIAYVAVLVGRIPLVLFLKYDPKDIMIAMGGFIFGPVTALFMSVIVSVLEMCTISGTGPIGCVMNIISTCSFACTASFVYQKRRTLSGAVMGLGFGCVSMITVMLLWNYLITPIYIGYPREQVVKLLLPVFLPFNMVKSGLNASFLMLLYKPVISVLRRSHLIEPAQTTQQTQIHIGIRLAAILVVITCILYILSCNGII